MYKCLDFAVVSMGIWDYISMKQWSFGRGRGSPSSLSGMDVPGGQGGRPGGLVGPPGQNAGNVGFHLLTAREVRGELRSSVARAGTQPPVSEMLGTGMSSMASLPSKTRPTQSSSGAPLSQVGLSDH